MHPTSTSPLVLVVDVRLGSSCGQQSWCGHGCGHPAFTLCWWGAVSLRNGWPLLADSQTVVGSPLQGPVFWDIKSICGVVSTILRRGDRGLG